MLQFFHRLNFDLGFLDRPLFQAEWLAASSTTTDLTDMSTCTQLANSIADDDSNDVCNGVFFKNDGVWGGVEVSQAWINAVAHAPTAAAYLQCTLLHTPR
jgi:hypothetical protein